MRSEAHSDTANPSPPPDLVTLTTDFGWSGSYVGELKGAILSRSRRAVLVDVCHTVDPQDIRQGAWILEAAARAFGPGTIHLAVVDPGVGTSRKVVALRARNRPVWLVGPDNGLLIPALDALGGCAEAWSIEPHAPAIRAGTVDPTFHGRDLMAPAVAHLVEGGPAEALGPRHDPDQLVRADHWEAHFVEQPRPAFRAEIAAIDRFGNLTLNLRTARLVERLGTGYNPRAVRIVLDRPAPHGRVEILGLDRTYGDHAPNDLIALTGSTGRLELAVVNGSAARRLVVEVGHPVQVDLVE